MGNKLKDSPSFCCIKKTYMGIFKNLFKNDEDTLSVINTKMATDEVNVRAFELANKLKSMLLAIGCTNDEIILNGVKFVIKENFRNVNDDVETLHYIGILFKDKEIINFLDIDKSFTVYNTQSEKYEWYYPSSFKVNKYFLEHADGIFNEVRTMQEKHKENCSKVLEQVKDL